MIKSDRTEATKPEYPYLAMAGKAVILITCKTRDRELTGMVVYSGLPGSCYPLGYYTDSWNADELRRCPDSITLQNA